MLKRPRCLLSVSFCAVMFVAVGSAAGCESAWVTETPDADVSMTPYEDVYRLLSTGKANGMMLPTRVEVSETLATLMFVTSGGVGTIPIVFAEADVRLKHHLGNDKWVVDLYKPDGKRLVRIESPNAKHANDLAMTLGALAVLTSD